MDFLYGPITETPPPEFVPPEMWPEFGTIAHPTTMCAREAVGGNPPGIRWSLWPITFEEYWGDKEPDLDAAKAGSLARNRAVAWKRLTRAPAPKGWRALSSRPSRVDGFYVIKKGEDYRKDWSGNARRNLREWEAAQAAGRYAIEPLQLAEFREAYRHSTVHKKTGSAFLDILERKQDISLCRENCSIWGVRELATGKIIAGNINYYSPTYKSSSRESPFILPEGKKAHASVGLVDHWTKEAIGRGADIVMSTHFWNPGEPKSWKGFSAFKAQFGYTFVAYPPTLWRFVRGKMF